MAEYSDLGKTLSNRASLEHELSLKQLQINRLLNITQAINNNLAADELFKMYESFLSWEMEVKKMALYIQDEDDWTCATSIGLSDDQVAIDIKPYLEGFDHLKNLNEPDHLLLKDFDVVIPVLHKASPIAYAFIGDCGDGENIYNKVQFIITITNIIAVAIENKRLFKRQLKQERLSREMELASEVQMKLVPAEFPIQDAYDIDRIYIPQIGVGGDYFDFVKLSDDKFLFCVADISGKGFAAALLMANFQANLRTLLHLSNDLAVFTTALNDALYNITKGEKFITLVLGVYEISSRTLRYVNAGHVHPYLCNGSSIKKLDRGCTLIGCFEELPEIEVGQEHVGQDSFLVAFTDGLTDLVNEGGDYFDGPLLEAFIMEQKNKTAEEFNKALIKRIEVFKGKNIYPDDITVLTAKIR